MSVRRGEGGETITETQMIVALMLLPLVAGLVEEGVPIKPCPPIDPGQGTAYCLATENCCNG